MKSGRYYSRLRQEQYPLPGINSYDPHQEDPSSYDHHTFARMYDDHHYDQHQPVTVKKYGYPYQQPPKPKKKAKAKAKKPEFPPAPKDYAAGASSKSPDLFCADADSDECRMVFKEAEKLLKQWKKQEKKLEKRHSGEEPDLMDLSSLLSQSNRKSEKKKDNKNKKKPSSKKELYFGPSLKNHDKQKNELYFGPTLSEEEYSSEVLDKEVHRLFDGTASGEADPDDHELAFLVYKVKKNSQEASTEDNYTYAIKSIRDKKNKELLAHQKQKAWNQQDSFEDENAEYKTEKKKKKTNVVYLLPLPHAATPSPPPLTNPVNNNYLVDQQAAVQPAYTAANNPWDQQQQPWSQYPVPAPAPQQYSQPVQSIPPAVNYGRTGPNKNDYWQQEPRYRQQQYRPPRVQDQARKPSEKKLTLKVRCV